MCFAGAMYDGSIRLCRTWAACRYERNTTLLIQRAYSVGKSACLGDDAICSMRVFGDDARKRPRRFAFDVHLRLRCRFCSLARAVIFVVDSAVCGALFRFSARLPTRKSVGLRKRMMVGVAILAPLGILQWACRIICAPGQVTNLGFVEMLEDRAVQTGRHVFNAWSSV